jgi:hypothetical protein
MCRWLERDPAGYQDGPSLYSYLGRNPMAGTDPYGLFFGEYWDDFKEGLGYFFGDGFDAKEAERKLRDAQRLLEERLREQVERGIISTDAQLSMVERMERDISAAAAQMHEIEAQQAKMVRDTAIEIGITVATAGAGSIAMRALTGGWKTRVFYSGQKSWGAAQSFARAKGMVTIDMTPLGKLANSLSKPLRRNGYVGLNRLVWSVASRIFARGARGDAVFIKGSYQRWNSVWRTVERPNLQGRGIKINEIHYHAAQRLARPRRRKLSPGRSALASSMRSRRPAPPHARRSRW